MEQQGTNWHSPIDPEDWKRLRQQGHDMLDDMFAFMATSATGEGPVWQPIPNEVRTSIVEPLPRDAGSLEDAYELFRQSILPYSVGNTHPGFMGWVHGAGSPVGMLGDMLAGGLNANLGGRDHMPIALEKQVVQWMRELFEFPEEASGLFVTGSSMANLIAVLVARARALGASVRTDGVNQQSGSELIAYTSMGAHTCIARAMDFAGLGSINLRRIAQGANGAIDITALANAIQDDLDIGRHPFLIVGTAGSVDTGAFDDLTALAAIASEKKIHFHVDGAFGALCALAPDLAPKIRGIEQADSIALDFHKWLHVPYDAGFVLVRDGKRHLDAFGGSPQSYLARESGGMSAGSPWPCDYGPDLSRGFRALKTWLTFKVYGTKALGQSISESCERARYLAQRIEASPELELLAPVNLNIVCFRYRAPADISDNINRQLLLSIQESGIAAPSSTVIAGKYAIRAALFNHRTRREELDQLIDYALVQGHTLLSSTH